jgi:hypothetical protein
MKKLLKLKITNLSERKRLGSYDFDGFPKDAVLLELHTGKLWLNESGLHGNNHYNLREIRNNAVEIQPGAYVYSPSRRWVHNHFDMVATSASVGELK